MFENDIEWIFPEKIEKVYESLKKEGSRIHSGGLTLNRLRPSNVKTLIDLQKTGLDFLSIEQGIIQIGPYLSVGEFIERSKDLKKDGNILVFLADVFSNAGSTSIRNRMTIGGSVVGAPSWSDIIPPLVAVDAKIEIFSGEKKQIDILELINNKPQKPFVVTKITVKDQDLNWFYRRLTNVRFDYPYMNFCAVRSNEKVKCVLRGSEERIKIFDIEEYKNEKIIFRDDMYFSADYKRHLLDIYIKETKENLGC